MIQQNELRLKNWVQTFSPRNEIVQIVDLSTNICKAGEYLNDYENIHPIVLSPEILEKCGFEWSIYHQAFHRHNDGHKTYDLNECYPSGYQFSTFKKQTLIGIPVQYLHQLQNLYFSLCGEELNYTQ